MNNMFQFRVLTQQVRQIHTTDILLKGGTKKSFSRSGVNSFKSKKGSGKTQTFKKLINRGTYQKKADPSVIDLLPTVSELQKLEDNKFDRVVKYDDDINRRLHIIGGFTVNQFNELFAKPITLLKTTEAQKLLNFVESTKTNSSVNNKLIITGESGIGKSTTLNQFHSFIDFSNSILIPFTNTNSLFDGSKDFKFNPVTGLYDQPMISKQFLRKFKSLNTREILANYKLKHDFFLTQSESNRRATLAAGRHSLIDLISLPFSTPDNKLSGTVRPVSVDSPLVLSHLFKELTDASNPHPTYLSVDNFTAFTHFNYSNYRDTSNKPIHVTKFQIAKNILDLISNKTSFAKGGVVLATSSLHRPTSTIDVALQNDFDDLPDLYANSKEFDFELANLLAVSNLQKFEIQKFSIEQIKQLLLMYLRLDMIHNEGDLSAAGLSSTQLAEYALNDLHKVSLPTLEKFAKSKYIISGNGNPHQFINSCVLSYV